MKTIEEKDKPTEKIQIATLEQVILARLDNIAEMISELLKLAKNEEE